MASKKMNKRAIDKVLNLPGVVDYKEYIEVKKEDGEWIVSIEIPDTTRIVELGGKAYFPGNGEAGQAVGQRIADALGAHVRGYQWGCEVVEKASHYYDETFCQEVEY